MSGPHAAARLRARRGVRRFRAGWAPFTRLPGDYVLRAEEENGLIPSPLCAAMARLMFIYAKEMQCLARWFLALPAFRACQAFRQPEADDGPVSAPSPAA